MNNTLTPEYIQFVDCGGKLEVLAQDVIDRVQYSPNFLLELNMLLSKHESPFEIVVIENEPPIRRLKSHFITNKS